MEPARPAPLRGLLRRLGSWLGISRRHLNGDERSRRESAIRPATDSAGDSIILERAGPPCGARTAMSGSVRPSPDDADGLIRVRMCHRASGDPDMAMNDPTVVAQSLYLEGRTADAESLYRKILSEHPDDCGALEGLGVLLVQGGGAVEAVGLFSRGLAIQPDSPRLHANLGEVLRLLGRLDEAMAHLRRATELDPAFAQSWGSLGLLAHFPRPLRIRRDRTSGGLAAPTHFAPTHINLANTLLARGRMNDAADELRRALEISPHHGVALMNLGRVLAETREPGRFEEAEALARRAVELMPGLPYAMSNLAHVLRLGGRTEEAKAWDERAYAAARRAAPRPGCATAPGAGAAQDEERRIEAEGRHPPQSPPQDDGAEARHVEGLVSMKDGRLDEAEASFREALRSDPTATAPGSSWRVRRNAAISSCLAESARLRPRGRPQAGGGLRDAGLHPQGAAARRRIPGHARAGRRSGGLTRIRALLRFGLAAVLDDRGLFAEAASQLESANALQSSGKAAPRPGVRSRQRVSVPREDHRGVHARVPRPASRLGRPGSASGLRGRPASIRDDADGTDPRLALPRPRRRRAARGPEDLPIVAAQIGQPAVDPFEALERLTPESTRAAARSYLALLDSIAPLTAARVVNKQPDNIDLLGMIALLWPGARVILCHRDPRDVALSCWQMGFVTNPWSNDWATSPVGSPIISGSSSTGDALDPSSGSIFPRAPRQRPGGSGSPHDRFRRARVGPGLPRIPREPPGGPDTQPGPGPPADPHAPPSVVGETTSPSSSPSSALRAIWSSTYRTRSSPVRKV